jgi:tRNA nucleotidyltransferase (CCA-adding enzyme)
MFNSKYKKLLNQVIETSTLSKKEIQEMKILAEKVLFGLKKSGIKATIGGSLAKNTLIKKENQDVDIFVEFNSEEEVASLEKNLKKIKTKGKLITVHGSRDYFRIEFPKVSLEIIPTVVCKNPENAKNITDLSISHVKYVTKKIRRNKKLANEIKLAKIFCSASDCYGAESYIQGFSGYALELLVIQFGSFIKFIKKIEKNKIIDPENKFKNENEISRELNESKLISPIILIDPTYKYRNVTAALSKETLEKFIEYIKDFLKKPDIKHFKKKIINKEEIKNYAKRTESKYLEVIIKTKKQEGDIAGTKMKKYFNFLIQQLKNKEQNILIEEFKYGGTGQKAIGYIVVKEKKRLEVRGPEIKRTEAAKKFKKGKKEIFEKKGVIWTIEEPSVKKIFQKAKEIEKEMDVKVEMKIR